MYPPSDCMAYWFAALDFHLRSGEKASEALRKATEDYAAVYIVDDDRTELARAATVTLQRLAELDEAKGGE